MVYIKSVLAGIAAVLVVCVIMALAVVAFALFPMVAEAGSGGIGAVSVGVSELPILLVLIVSFAGGFYLEFRRASKPRS